jgi:hypothetical protein
MGLLSQPISSAGGSDALWEKVKTDATYIAIVAVVAYFGAMI